jgi:hypothetical protein
VTGHGINIIEAVEIFSMASFFRSQAFRLERIWLGRRILTGVFFPQLHITSLIQGVFQANGIFFFQKVLVLFDCKLKNS